METKLYLIKSLAPWMMEELLEFSNSTAFTVLFIRKQLAIYEKDISKLKANGITVKYLSFSKINTEDIAFCVTFIFKLRRKFIGLKNFIWGIKSCYWFLMLDKEIIKNIECIHAQFASQAAILALMFKECRNIKYYFTFHAHDIYFNNRWFPLLCENSVISFSISKYNVNYVKKKFNIDSNKIKISRLGVRASEKDLDFLCKNIDNKKKIDIGFLSNLTEKKGLRYLLEAYKQLAVEFPGKYLLNIAGSGDLEDYLMEFIQKNNFEAQLKYFGPIYHAAKAKFYNNLDLFVLPSVTLENDMDGIPVVLMEAITYGIPIISTKVSGIPEICIHNYNGLLVNERNSAELKDAITKIVDNNLEYETFSQNAIEVAKKYYNLPTNSKSKLVKMNWI